MAEFNRVLISVAFRRFAPFALLLGLLLSLGLGSVPVLAIGAGVGLAESGKLQTEASEAASFDSALVTDSELVEFRQVVIENLQSQRSFRDDAANLAVTAADKHRQLLIQSRSLKAKLVKVEKHLGAVVVGGFVHSKDGKELDVTAEADEVRHAGTIAVVTEELLAKMKDVRFESQLASDRESSALQEKEQLESALAQADEQMTKAVFTLATFNAAAQARDANIVRREAELVASQAAMPLVQVAPTMKVNAQIADAVSRLLAKASEDGIEFGGWGYRQRAMQISLRRAHCGTSEFAIFDRPSSSCSPPTATPGHSQHELGLAIDFTENGNILNRSSAGFLWLKENASEFGLKNLLSEPWHWSTNGK